MNIKRSTFVAGAAAGMGAALFSSGGASAARAGIGASSKSVRGSWIVDDRGSFRYRALTNAIEERDIPLPREVFALVMRDGRTIPASAFSVESGPMFAPDAVELSLVHPASGVRVVWKASGGDDLRQLLRIEALRHDVHLARVVMFDFQHLPGVYVSGTVDGSPLAAGTVYAAVEHPLSQADAIFDRGSCWLPINLPLRSSAPVTVSSVVGAVRKGQLRREFNAYIDRYRPRAYAPFLHYNSWYDLGYFNRYNERECLDRIHAFGEALRVRRNVALKSFLFDDGWDDPNRLWHFNAGFPQGFAPLRTAAATYGAAPGAWLSPWGGYGTPREERLASARRLGYEIDADGLALSAPKYYSLFESVVERFIRNGGVNQFKIDGTGSAADVFPGSRFGSDFAAAISLIETMRKLEPEIFVNLTTGTYPSPFWLRYCDSIWRGGEDHDFTGEGTHRQQWITYRDAQTYENVVLGGPLYPLNSLMLHGLIYARYAEHLQDDPSNDFPKEVQSYFASGTQLQELYCTPDLLGERHWDEIARWARWSATNAGTLRDSHWIGGDPDRLDVYGWAAWTPAKAIVTLRNPAARAQEYVLDVGHALELPEDAETAYRAATDRYESGKPAIVALEPFEVRTIEAFPEA